MTPEEVRIYKLLVTIQRMIQDRVPLIEEQDGEAADYKYFRLIDNACSENIDKLMRDVGRRHLTEASFMEIT